MAHSCGVYPAYPALFCLSHYRDPKNGPISVATSTSEVSLAASACVAVPSRLKRRAIHGCFTEGLALLSRGTRYFMLGQTNAQKSASWRVASAARRPLGAHRQTGCPNRTNLAGSTLFTSFRHRPRILNAPPAPGASIDIRFYARHVGIPELTRSYRLTVTIGGVATMGLSGTESRPTRASGSLGRFKRLLVRSYCPAGPSLMEARGL